MELTTNRFSSPSVEALLNASFEDMTAEVKLNAATMGKRGLPLLHGDQMSLYFEKTFLSCQGLIAECNKILQFETTCFQVSEHDTLVDQQVRQLENDLHTAQETLHPLSSKVRNAEKPRNAHRALLVRTLIIAICLFDGLMSTKTFEQNGFGLLSAYFMGGIFALVLAGAAHLAPKVIALGKTVRKQRLIALAIFVFSTIVFYAIADSRVQFLKGFFRAQGIASYDASPWDFVLLSDFCFAVSVGLYFIFMPTDGDRAAALQYNDLVAAQQHASAHTSALEHKKTSLQQSKAALRIDNSSVVIYGRMTEMGIAHFAEKLFAEWKNTNLLNRTDTGVPTCFSTPFPFQFTFYFNN